MKFFEEMKCQQKIFFSVKTQFLILNLLRRILDKGNSNFQYSSKKYRITCYMDRKSLYILGFLDV